jgi:predicted  nucleic acid-binding Zn-ribbon protein
VHGNAINELNVNPVHESELKSHAADTIDRLREQERELREYQPRMFYERNEAAEEVCELAEQCDELIVTLERLRSSSKNGLLAQVAEL